MMRRHLIYLLTWAALAATLVTACQLEPQPQGANSLDDMHKITLQAVFGDAPLAGTKVAIADTYGANFTWSAGDQIAVHSSDGNYYVIPLMDGAGEASATFEGELSGAQDYFAVYPASAIVADNYGNDILQVILPDSYTISGSMGAASPLPMIAVNNNSTLSFKHVGAIYRFTLDDVPSGTNQITVTFDKVVTGTFTVTNPNSNAPFIATDAGSTGRTVTFNLSSALAAETDGFVLNVPVPTGTYAGNIMVVATGGGKVQAKIPNPRTITRASGRQISKALVNPIPAGFGGPFTYNDKEYYISQGSMYKTASGYALYSDWTGGLDQYSVTAPDTQTWAGNSYFNWVHLAGLFDTSINTGANESIDNDKTPITGCKLPEKDFWVAAVPSSSTHPETNRAGSTVNGKADCLYAKVTVVKSGGWSDISGGQRQDGGYWLGLILFPDGENFTTSGFSFGDNNANITTRTSYTNTVTQAMPEAILTALLDVGCVFLPTSGSYAGSSWFNGGNIGRYWSASSYDGTYAYHLFLGSLSVNPATYRNKSSDYYLVRLIQE